MSSQQISYPDNAIVVPQAGEVVSPEEPTSAGTTDTNASSNADYFDGHVSTSQAAEVPQIGERAAPGMGFAPGQQQHAGPGGAPGVGGGKYGDMGKMVMGIVGTVAASQASHGGGGHYGHKKKHGKGALLATGAKMAYDMYNKKAGGKPGMPGQQMQQPAQGGGGAMYGGHQQQPGQPMYGAPAQQQQQQQQLYGAPMYGQQQMMPHQPGMPPYGH